MKTIWDALSSTLPSVITEWPVLSAGEQTRLSWARRIENMEELPEFYRAYVGALVEQTGEFPYTVLTPSYAGFLTRTTEKLMCTTDDAVHCLERVDEQPPVTVFRYEDISYIEIGCILLKSWIKYSGKTIGGAYTSMTLKFNTVTDYLFLPAVERVRKQGGVDHAADLGVERAKFSYLAQSNYKFMNAARKSLVPGESVRESVMQPEIRTKLVTIFGRSFFRTRAPAHIMILTDKELIVVSDENQDTWGGEIKHGSIRTCIPLAKIVRASSTTLADDLLQLSLCLPGPEQLDFCFTRGQQPAIQQLLDHIATAPIAP